uniref:Uncharacterized protein n=1 Tax=Oryza glumipatula TaxID=40148 RepID=A0A0D9ZJ67_9ORYZ
MELLRSIGCCVAKLWFWAVISYGPRPIYFSGKASPYGLPPAPTLFPHAFERKPSRGDPPARRSERPMPVLPIDPRPLLAHALFSALESNTLYKATCSSKLGL